MADKAGTIRVWQSREGCSIQLTDDQYMVYYVKRYKDNRGFGEVKEGPIQTATILDVNLGDVLDAIINTTRSEDSHG